MPACVPSTKYLLPPVPPKVSTLTVIAYVVADGAPPGLLLPVVCWMFK